MWEYKVTQNFHQIWTHPVKIIPYLKEWLKDQRWAGVLTLEEFRIAKQDVFKIFNSNTYKFLGLIVDLTIGGNSAPAKTYFIPFEISLQPKNDDLFPITLKCTDGFLFLRPAENSSAFYDVFYNLLMEESRIETQNSNIIKFHKIPNNSSEDVRFNSKRELGGGNTTNTVLMVEWSDANRWLFKIFRGFSRNTEVMMLNTLYQVGFQKIPLPIGWVTLEIGNKEFPLFLITEFIETNGDGGWPFWTNLKNQMNSWEPSNSLQTVDVKRYCEILGETIGEFHYYSSKAKTPLFTPEPISAADISKWKSKIQNLFQEIEFQINNCFPSESNFLMLLNLLKNDLTDVLTDKLWDKLRNIQKIKIHQDLHLSQMLSKSNNTVSFILIDFEGDPLLSTDDKFGKDPIFRDLASIDSAFYYIKFNALREFFSRRGSAEVESFVELYTTTLLNVQFQFGDHQLPLLQLLHFANGWEHYCREKFLTSYLKDLMARNLTFNLKSLSSSEFKGILRIFRIERFIKELYYESQFRKEMIIVPTLGLLELFQKTV